MHELEIFDVSPYVYTGTAAIEQQYYGLPVGGIKLLLADITLAFGRGNSVVLAFDSKTNKKELYPSYKSNRTPNRAVLIQLQFLLEHLQYAGLHCYKFDNVEADDIVDWAIFQNVLNYQGVVIHGNDHDLLHSLTENAIYKPIRKSENIISTSSFSLLADKDREIPYNLISADKVFFGCKSDCIRPFKSASGISNKQLFDAYVQLLTDHELIDDYWETVSKNNLLYFIENSELFTDSDRSELRVRVDLVFPLDCPEGVQIIPNVVKDLNKDAYGNLLTMVKDMGGIRTLRLRFQEIQGIFLESIKEYASRYKTGSVSVDSNLEVEPSYEIEALPVDAFMGKHF